jgi:hypothetical protein
VFPPGDLEKCVNWVYTVRFKRVGQYCVVKIIIRAPQSVLGPTIQGARAETVLT